MSSEMKTKKNSVRCPKCGVLVLKTDRFCALCGTEQPAPPKQPEPAGKPADVQADWKLCSGCGARISKTSAFCIQCGCKQWFTALPDLILEPEPQKEEPRKEEPPKKEPQKEEPRKEEPQKEEPRKEEPQKEDPPKEEHAKEEPRKEEPAEDPLNAEAPADTAPAHHLRSGTLLQGRYAVEAAIGEGAFGITYKGKDQILGISVAIKEYFPSNCAKRDHSHSNAVTVTGSSHQTVFDRDMQRFLQEAQVLAKLRGEPGVVSVQNFFNENGTAYIVMDYLNGITLSAYLRRFGPFDPETLASILSPVLDALSKVHAEDMIHGDISPDNIMMLRGGRLKLLDFGAARKITEENRLSVVLKPGYAPVEQYQAQGKLGPWTDVYALCATLYKCITGITPEESTERTLKDTVLPPSELGVAVPVKFEQALMRGMCVQSEHRCQTLEALRKSICEKSPENTGSIQIRRICLPEEEPAYSGDDFAAGEQDEIKTEVREVDVLDIF